MTDLRMFSPESRALWLLSISIAFVNWSPQVVVGLLEGPEHVTAVTVAQRLAAASGILLMAANAYLSPRIAASFSTGDVASLQALVRRTVWFVIPVSLVPVVGLWTWREEVLGLFGTSDLDRSAVLGIFMAGQLVNLATGPAAQLLMMTGHAELMLRISMGSLLVGVVIGSGLYAADIGYLAVPIAGAVAVGLQNLVAAVASFKVLRVSVL